MVWNLGFLLLQLLYSNWHTTHSRSHVLFTYGHTPLDDSNRPYWIPFFLGYLRDSGLLGCLFSLTRALAALTVVNNWPFIFAGISSPWMHPNPMICRFIINRGFLSFHFLLTIFSFFGNLEDYYTNYNFSNRFPFTMACFHSITFLFSYSIYPCYLFEKNKKNTKSVPSEMLQKELFMLLLLLWISSVAHISLLYRMYLTLEEKKSWPQSSLKSDLATIRIHQKHRICIS